MKKLSTVLLFLLGTGVFFLSACMDQPEAPVEDHGASNAVRLPGPVDEGGTTVIDSIPMDRMDTATNPSMDGKP